jgi:ketosteroid isomerase-like protein
LDGIGPVSAVTPQEVTKQFVSAINAHDVERLASLVTSDHRFIDSLGDVAEGRDAVRDGWKLYFAMAPDYAFDIRRCFVAQDGATEVMLVGVASGSYQSVKIRENLWTYCAGFVFRNSASVRVVRFAKRKT